MSEADCARLIARLLAERAIARTDPLVQRAIIDAAFHDELNRRLAQSGLRLLDNPYADHVAVALADGADTAVFAKGDGYSSNNAAVQRDGVALLVLLWALIVLEKRERQISRAADEQADMFGAAKPTPRGEAASRGIPESVLLADYGAQLGGKMRINVNLGILSRLGFIERRNKVIHEGPLLDLAFDYAELAPRIIDGALGELLKQRAAAQGGAAGGDRAADDRVAPGDGTETDADAGGEAADPRT
jgi:hypothetical protein